MRRWLLFGAGVGLATLAAGGYLLAGLWSVKPPIVVGLLHSRTGPLAASERPMLDAEILALEEINADGGLLGRTVKWVIVDGRSQDATFAQQAQRLIADERVSAVFGCAASHSRKSVKPVFEENNHLLFYPAVCEGAEESPNIVYAGGSANQQITAALSWCVRTLKSRTFFLVGTDSVGPHVINALARDRLHSLGAKVAGEAYILPDGREVGAAIEAIKKAAPDVVVTNLEGDSIAAFYEGLARAGLTPDRPRVVSLSLTEEELKTLPLKDMVGHFAAWRYFQSIDRPENAAFVRRFKAKYGPDRVTNDGASAAYSSVKVWAQAVVNAGTDEVGAVREAARGLSVNAPEAVLSIDSQSVCGWRPFFLGKIRLDGQFDIVFALPKPINPVPYPATRSRAEWNALVDRLWADWDGQWSNPARAAPVGR